MVVSQRGTKYQARVNETNGKYHRYSFDTVTEALEWETEARGQKALGLPIEPPRALQALQTFSEFYTSEQPKLWGPKNQSNTVKNSVAKYFPDLPLAKLNYKTVVNLVNLWKTEGMKATTINGRIARMQVLHKHAHTLGLIKDKIDDWPRQSTKHMKLSREKFMTADEETTIIKTLINLQLPQYVAAFMFMMDTGCRLAELFNSTRANTRPITWDEVSKSAGGRMDDVYDPESGLPRAVVKLRSKTGLSSERVLPLTPRVTEQLLWSSERGDETPLGPLRLKTYQTVFKAVIDDQNLDATIVPYTTRHTCASRLVQRGAPLANIMKWMGHSKIEQTLQYAKLRHTDLMDIGSLLSLENQ